MIHNIHILLYTYVSLYIVSFIFMPCNHTVQLYLLIFILFTTHHMCITLIIVIMLLSLGDSFVPLLK